MDYKRIYTCIIQSRINNIPVGYTEEHHILPKCLGGNDEKTNLVKLTAREHFICHLLLAKIHPNNKGIVYAAYMMTISSNGQLRNNKEYQWIKKKRSILAKQMTGEKNGMFGKRWFHNPITLEFGVFEKCPEGWILGKSEKAKCIVCNDYTGSRKRKYCSLHKPKNLTPIQRGYIMNDNNKNKIKNYCLSRNKENHPQYGKRWINNRIENRMVLKELVQSYLDNGWVIGKIKQ